MYGTCRRINRCVIKKSFTLWVLVELPATRVSKKTIALGKDARQHAFSEGSQFWSGGQRMRQDESVDIYRTNALIIDQLC